MAGYKIISAIQTLIGLFLAFSLVDGMSAIGMNDAFFGTISAWWNPFTFWGYLIAAIFLLQLVKVFTVKTE